MSCTNGVGMEEKIKSLATNGIVTRQLLLAGGVPRPVVQAAEKSGALTVVRRGIYRIEDCDDEVREAVAAGGTLTCMSALARSGVGTPDDDKIHLRRPPQRRRDGRVAGARECRPGIVTGQPPVDSVEDALLVAASNHGAEDVVVVIDSVLNKKIRTRAELEAAFAEAPKTTQRLLGMATGLADSALETVTRLRLERLQIRVRPQHYVPGAGHYDLLVGKRLLVELDGYEYHSDRSQFREDRRRDRRAAELGYKVLRFTWEDVMNNWEMVVATILGYVRRDFHRRSP